jgi:uncharacterized protein YndB with AHSA1/START domain
MVSRELPAPPESVFDWLTQADKLARWMSPVGEAIASADPRPGGALLITMVGADMRIEHTGEFVEVTRPRRLVFTWNSEYTNGESLVTIDLEARGGGTLLTLRHERLPIDQAESHGGGWGRMLDRLATELAKGG